MITGPDQADPNARLNTEERVLADRLAQVAPQGEPSSALDARILAAARASINAGGAAGTGSRPGARRRWPAITAVAATLMLAAGIAWQLRPVDEFQVESSEAPRASMPAARVAEVSPPADEAKTLPEQGKSARMPVPPPENSAPADDAEAETAAPVADKAERAQENAERRPEPSESPMTFDQPAPMDSDEATASPVPASAPRPAPEPSAFPPPAHPAPAAAAGAMAGQQAATAIGTGAAAPTGQAGAVVQRGRQQAEDKAKSAAAMKTTRPVTPAVQRVKSPDAAAEADTRALDRVEVTGSRLKRFDDQPLDDQPPALADSPQVRQAWLQRVRQLIVEGELAAARDSLHEYQRRYPDAPLPDDLQALLAE